MRLAQIILKPKSSLSPSTKILTRKENYATYRVNIAPSSTLATPTLGDQNNPQVLKTDVNGNIYTTKHNEILKSTCDQNKCKEKVCPTLCGKPSGEKDKAIGHFTTNPTHANFIVSNQDLDGKKQTQYAKGYSQSHEVNSADVNIHKRRSASLNKDTQALKNIHDNDHDKE